MPQNPTLPPKWPRSGVTFHYKSENKPKNVHVGIKVKDDYT